MKRIITSAAVLFLTAVYIHASSYRISDITYSIAGRTNAKLLERNIPVDKLTVFPDETALLKYIEDYKQQLYNTRFFEEVDLDYTVSAPDQNDLCTVSLSSSLKDSFHLLALPYFKYDSNDGAVFKIKIKGEDNIIIIGFKNNKIIIRINIIIQLTLFGV